MQSTNNDRLVTLALGALMVYNLFDLAATLILLNMKEIVEANPFMAAAYRDSPFTFFAVKLALVTLGGILIYRLRNHPKARPGFVRTLLYAATLVYVANITYQIFFLIRIAAH